MQPASLLVRGGVLLHLDRPDVTRADVRVTDGVITEVGPDLTGDEPVLDATGRWVMPGLVVGHHHLYSALATGMPLLPEAPTSFADMLAKVWWRLDVAHDRVSVHTSGRVGGVQALRAGVTTVVDHHASPSFIEGSLEVLDQALDEVGLRRVLCYEVTDRHGPDGAREGLAAHAGLLSRDGGGQRAVLIGGHASFTLEDETIRSMGAMAREAGVGVHIHVAEAADDAALTGESPVARLARLGALVPGSVLAHGVHLTDDDLARVADAGAWLTHQPRSNMNNAVGYAPLARFPERTALGTDGIGADMLAELQAGWFRAAEAGVGWSPERWRQALTAGADMAGAQLGVTLGRLEPGAAGDLVVLDPIPGPPLTRANLAASLVFRFTSAAVRDVVVAGSLRLSDRQPTGVDAAALDRRATRVAQDLWSRMV